MTCPSRRRAWRRSILLVALVLAGSATLHAQNPFREYRSMEPDSPGRPADWDVPGEFVVGRLMYPPRSGDRMSRGNWNEGGTSWTVDYPRGDRTFASLLERLTVLDVRSVEQVVDLDDEDDIFHWPFLMVAMPGSWDLTDEQAIKLREYLLRGGFLLADSFFGDQEWAGFMDSMRRVFPDRPVIDLPDDHPLFSVVYDFSQEKTQIRNWRTLGCCGGYRGGESGATPRWRGVLDDDGRIMAAMSFNNDMGDSWQHADDPSYPQEDSQLGLRLGVNYVIYTMTH